MGPRSTTNVSVCKKSPLTIKSLERPQNGRGASREALGRMAKLSRFSSWTPSLVGAHADFIFKFYCKLFQFLHKFKFCPNFKVN